MKRFWNDVAVREAETGFGIELDGRPVRTPAGNALVVPTRALAEAIATEWGDCGDELNPRAMPLTGLTNAAIDRIAPDPVSFASGLAKYGEADLTCYRAEGPDALVRRQAESWDILLDWARRRYDVDFACSSGIVHVAQPADTVAKLAHSVAILDPFRLAALAPIVTIGGSLVAGLAVLEEALPADSAWEAVSLDERWQAEQWGEDEEATAALDARRADFLSAACFLSLLG
ncbi:ATPase [Sphingomonas sp. HDW15A]|uniref:ATP12 family chaperone protein n=1 Tax=Sphingomonas sp. HDW15A TaxID=2714942 RepID=UPI00140C6BA2|nr:ATP12 family protein [Sphingomonas sp. HDW15A]QIK95257.1 ATPase [Sphingomonas sp. HDW15A]